MLSNHNTLLQTTATLTRPTTQARLQHQRSCKMLCELWLLSAEAFLKIGKLDEALKAVSEAENVDWTTHANVWCILGRIRIAQNQKDKAISAFQKGLVTKPNDVECRVWLAKTHFEMGELEIAEGILEAVTQENGWDNPSAW
jgi:tetratricopeptide (TPR) repeat protein